MFIQRFFLAQHSRCDDLQLHKSQQEKQTLNKLGVVKTNPEIISFSGNRTTLNHISEARKFQTETKETYFGNDRDFPHEFLLDSSSGCDEDIFIFDNFSAPASTLKFEALSETLISPFSISCCCFFKRAFCFARSRALFNLALSC